MKRSGWGIRPKMRPVGSQTPATAPASRWGWRDTSSVGPAFARRRSGGRPGPPRSSASRCTGSARTNLPSPWATGSSIVAASVRDERAEARPWATAGPSAPRNGPSRCAQASRGAGRGPPGSRPASHQHLEPVADPQDQPAAVVEPAQRVAQHGPEPGGQDPAGAQVVAVGEAAGDGQDLEARRAPGRSRSAGRRARSRRRPPPAPRRRPFPRRSSFREPAGRSRGGVS